MPASPIVAEHDGVTFALRDGAAVLLDRHGRPVGPPVEPARVRFALLQRLSLFGVRSEALGLVVEAPPDRAPGTPPVLVYTATTTDGPDWPPSCLAEVEAWLRYHDGPEVTLAGQVDTLAEVRRIAADPDVESAESLGMDLSALTRLRRPVQDGGQDPN